MFLRKIDSCSIPSFRDATYVPIKRPLNYPVIGCNGKQLVTWDFLKKTGRKNRVVTFFEK